MSLAALIRKGGLSTPATPCDNRDNCDEQA